MFFTRTALFKDRKDAGQKLAEALTQFKSQANNVVVLALPRGGVPVAEVIAKSLGAPLDLLMVDIA
jgi:putative phosphoribosyl transferase